MSAFLGVIPVGDMPLGGVMVAEAYLGDVLVFRKSHPAAPYLEIDPEVLWVNPDWAVDNDVYSNTNWNID